MSQVVRIEKVKGLVGGMVFGPVRSRRFGRSLGINPLPPDRKLCTFNCVYCECGPTSQAESRRLDAQPFPLADEVVESAREAIGTLHRGDVSIDSLTLTGNGETILHPVFEEIVDGLVELRDQTLPKAQIVVLTNGARLGDPSVRRALERVDQCVVKLDAGSESTFQTINRPLEAIALDELTEAISALPRIIVQTLFVRGRVDNTREDEIETWRRRVERIRPRRVQVYSLDRSPAEPGLVAVPRADLERIAARVRDQTRLAVDVHG